MSASANDISKLRRMINEPLTTTYSDAILITYIETYPNLDNEGLTSGDDGWVVSYDLNAAASEIWQEKASAVQTYYNFSADGGKYDQDRLFETALEQARYYASRRRATSRDTHKTPVENTVNEVGYPQDALVYDGELFTWRAN